MPNRTAETLSFFINRLTAPGRTLLVQGLYLADLEARRCLGRPLTPLNYIIYDGGPFDTDILAELDTMVSQGLLKAESGEEPTYTFGEREMQTAFSEAEAYVLNHVVDMVRAAAANKTLDGLIAQSKPMVDTRQRNGFGGRLQMELLDNEAIIPGLELPKVLQSIKDLDAGKGRPLEEVMAELRAKVGQ